MLANTQKKYYKDTKDYDTFMINSEMEMERKSNKKVIK